jgi:DNA-binding NarL/FixJ family response regulator
VAVPAVRTSRAAAGKRMIRVILVDDHVVMRQGLGGLLRRLGDMEIAGEASDGESAIELVRQVRPDVVLMDISLPGMNGIEATRIIHAELPGVRIIGLSMFEEAERGDAMREAGAVSYISKSEPSDAVVAAIRKAAGTKVRKTKKKTARKRRKGT